jgi:hypothetical protein
MVLHTLSNINIPNYTITKLLANTAYRFTLTPYLNGIAGYSQIVNINTLAIIGAVSVNNVIETSALITWNTQAYSYYSVSISWIDTALIPVYNAQKPNFNNSYVTGTANNILASSYTVRNLSPNHSYYFILTAYNLAGVATPSTISNTIVTLATVGSISFSRETTTINSIVISWGRGTYTNVSVSWSIGNTLVASQALITDTTYTITGLSPNITYNIAVVPYNSIGNPGSFTSTAAITTIALVNDIYIDPNTITATSLIVSWTAAPYYSIRVKWYGSPPGSIFGIIGTSCAVSNLLPNQSYIFKVIPYNNGTPIYSGTPIVSNTIVTLATVGSISIDQTTVTPFGMTVTWNTATYTTVNLSINNNILINGIRGTSQVITGLMPNTLYTIQVYPVNSVGAVGPPQVYTQYTRPNIPYFNAVSRTPTSITLTWNATTSSSVNIQWDGGNYQNNIISPTSTITISNLNSNVRYTFTLIPFNQNNLPGASISTNAVTLAQLGSNIVTLTGITETTAIVNWTLGTYTQVYLQWNAPSSPSPYLNSTTRSYQITGLSPNISYTVNIIPLNSIDQPATSPVTTTIVTLPHIGAINPQAIMSNSITIGWDNTSAATYYNIAYSETIISDFQPSYDQVIQSLTISGNNQSYTANNLHADRAYNFTVIPLNSLSNQGAGYTTNYIRTNANIDQFYIDYGNYSSTTVNVVWSPSTPTTYTNIAVFWTPPDNGGSAYTQKRSPYTASKLKPNTTYSFSATSYNANTNAGNTLYATTNIMTLGDIIFLSPFIAPYSILLNWGSINNYYAVNVSWYPTTNSSGLGFDAGSVYLISSSNFLTPNLVANTQYNFSLIASNQLLVASPPVIVQYTTLPVIGQISRQSITDTSITISWSASPSYQSVNLYWTLVNSSIVYQHLNITDVSTSAVNLLSNSEYQIYVAPVNSAGIEGDVSNTLTIVTYATVGPVTINNLTDSSASIYWGTGTYTNVSLSSITTIDGQLHNSSIILDSTNNNYPINNLSPNTSYTFIVGPINFIGEIGVSSLATVMTLPQLNINDANTILQLNSLTYILTGSYSNFDVIGAGASRSNIGNTFTISGLNENTGYTTRFIPYNTCNVTGMNSIRTTYTLASVSQPFINNNEITNNTVRIHWQSSSATYIIANWMQNQNQIYSSRIYSPTKYVDLQNLQPNTAYSFNIAPYNYSNIINTAGILSTSTITLGSIDPNSVTTLINTGSVLEIGWANINCAYSMINYRSLQDQNSQLVPVTDINGNPLQIFDPFYTFNEINANVTYEFDITPYNRNNLPGATVIYNITSLPSILDIHINQSKTTYNSLEIDWLIQGYYYNYAVINWSSIYGSFNSTNQYSFNAISTSYVINNLQPNTLYTVIAFSYNAGTPPLNNVSSSVATITLPKIINVSQNIYTNYAVFNISGGYSNIAVTQNGLNKGLYLKNQAITLSSLNVNSAYNISFTPYNDNNLSGSTCNISFATLSTIDTLSVTNVSETTADLRWNATGNADIKLTYSAANITVFDNKTTNTYYNLTGLSQNTLYTATVTPVNSIGTYNYTNANNVAFITNPNITTISTSSIDYSSAYINLTGNFSSYTLSYSDPTNNFKYIYGITNPSYLLTGLTANVVYNITASPSNFAISPVAGISQSTSFTTLTVINNIIIGNGYPTDTSLYLSWTGIYDSATLSGWQVGDSFPIGSSYLIDKQLAPNTDYTITVKPYDNVNYKLGHTLSCNITTLANIPNGISVSSYTDTSAIITWTPSQNFDNIVLSWVKNGNTITSVPQNASVSTYQISGLNAYTSYVVNALPYNHLQQPNPAASVHASFITYTNITVFSITHTDINQISLSWSGTFVSSRLTWSPANSLGISSYTSGSGPGPITTTVSNLIQNTQYVFTVTSYDNHQIAGVVPTPITQYTLPTIGTITINNITDTSVDLNSNGGSFDSVNIVANGLTSITHNNVFLPYTFHGLSPNSQYTFTITPENINVGGVAQTTAAIYTLADINTSIYTIIAHPNSFDITNIDSTTCYNYRIITNPGNFNTGLQTGTQITVSSLNPNSVYSVQVIAYNIQGGANPQTPFNVVTTVQITGVSIGTITETTIDISWASNNATYTVVYWKINGSNASYTTSINLTTTSYRISGLTPYTSYNIQIIQYNQAIPAVGSVPYTNTVVTEAKITGLTLQSYTTTSATISWDTTAYDHATTYYANVTNNINSSEVVSIPPYTFNNVLAANTTYNLFVKPYSPAPANIPGAIVSLTVTTKPLITQVTVRSYDSTTAIVDWSTGTYAFNYVILEANTNNGPGQLANSQLTYTYQQTLLPNTSYVFSVTPYNIDSLQVAGAIVSSTPIITLALITNFNASVATNDIVMSWNNRGYSTINISWDNSNGDSGYVLGYTGSQFSFGGYLTPSSTYKITLIPYNQVGIANTIASQTPAIYQTTYPLLLTLTASNITATTMTITWAGYYSSIRLSWTWPGNAVGGGPLTQTGTSINLPGLLPNIIYTFTATPLNSIPLSGAALITVATTLGVLLPNSVTIADSSITTTTATVSWLGGTYQNVTIYWSGPNSGSQSQIASSPYLLHGLSVNSTYTISVVPYNSNNMPGTAVYAAAPIVTLPAITTLIAQNVTSNNIQIVWAGFYTYINLTWTGTNGTSGLQNNLSGTMYDFANNLFPNITYTFTITPFNIVNKAGAPFTITQSTSS